MISTMWLKRGMPEFAALAELAPGIVNQATPASAIAPMARCFSLIRAPPFVRSGNPAPALRRLDAPRPGARTAANRPVELLLTAIAGCTAIDVDILTSRRAEPDSFIVEADAEKVRDEKGRNLLTDITVTFRIRFPAGEGGDAARTLLPDAVQRSHERLCTVSRTVELGTAVTPRIE